MEKFKVSFVANNQQLTATGTKHASDTYADIEAAFALGERWTDMDSVSAVWWNDFTRIATVLDSEGKCTVPHEVLTRKGCVRVNLVGSVVEDGELVTRLTSYSAEAVHVNEKIKLTGNEPQTITPSQYEQFVANVKADADRAESAKESAETASASAQGYAQSASASASSASESATLAEQAKQSAQASAQNAQISAQTAENAKDDAELARDEILGMRATATTLEEGSQATANYSNGVLSLGIPRGDTGATGAKGDKGDTGATPNLTIGNVETLEPTESATATITGTAENPVLNLGIPQGDTGEVSLADLSTLLPTDTASGQIASFPDGQSVIPLLSLLADIEPIQDLHGYDKPWVGGAGKNKMPTIVGGSNRGVTAVVNTDGSVTLNGTANGVAVFYSEYFTVKAGTYYITCGTSERTVVAVYLDGVSGSASEGARLTFSEDTSTRCAVQVYSGQTASNVTVYPMLRLTSETDATYAPYSNICPISGHTEVNTQRTGINVWDEEWELGSYNNSTGEPTTSDNTIRSKNRISVKPSTTYYVKNGGMGAIFVYWYDANDDFISYENVTNATIVALSNAHYMRFRTQSTYGNTYNNDISINYPSTDTEYHAYEGTTYTTDLGQTVYGGTLDVVSGELVVDRVVDTFNGSEAWAKDNDLSGGIHRFYLRNDTIKKYSDYTNVLLSNRCKAVNNYQYAPNMNEDFAITAYSIFINNSNWAYIFSKTIDTVNGIKAWLADEPLQFCYELATPQTIQLTPQEVRTLLGQNNVWADSGEVEVVYKADVTKWVEKKLS